MSRASELVGASAEPEQGELAEKCDQCDTITYTPNLEDAKWCCRCGAKLPGEYVTLPLAQRDDMYADLDRLNAALPDVSGLIKALEWYADCGKAGNLARVALADFRAKQGGV